MKIITAIGNSKFNEELSKIKEYEIMGKDIQYQEGIFEMLEKKNNINSIIISEKILGKSNIFELIDKIKEIKKEIKIIFIFKEKKGIKKEDLNIKNVYKIFYNNKVDIEEINKILLKNKNIKINYKENKSINNKMGNDKKINLIKNKIKDSSKIINNKINLIKNNKLIKETKKENKIICILGAKGVGKSIFSILLSFNFESKKILLIDSSSEENNISIILGIKRKNKKIKINKNVDLILLNKKNNIEKEIKQVYEKYDFILIDTITEKEEDFIKFSNFNILLVEPNLLGINITRKILENYINKFNIKKEKIKIVFNKVNINSIDKSILKELFYDFNILGKIKLNNKYNLIINKNMKIMDRKIKNEYLKIIKKI